MRKRPGHSTQQIDGLRLTIDCLPVATREAMLEGLSSNERIIVGAYVDEQGGVCPMLAAHRCGGRTDFLSFAKSWDRFTRAAGKARRATRRELDVLVSLLEDSLMREGDMNLARAIEQHRELRGRSERERDALARTADPPGEIRAGRLGSARALRFLGRAPAAGLVAGLSEQ